MSYPEWSMGPYNETSCQHDWQGFSDGVYCRKCYCPHPYYTPGLIDGLIKKALDDHIAKYHQDDILNRCAPSTQLFVDIIPPRRKEERGKR